MTPNPTGWPLRALAIRHPLTAEHLAAVAAVAAAILIVLSSAWTGLGEPLNFDEGYNLTLVRHLVATGRYATEVAGTPLRWFDPEASTGPTVLIPVAVMVKLLGLDVTSLRLFALGFLVLFVVGAYLAARAQAGWLGGSSVVLLLSLVPSDPHGTRLPILGEVPSLAFLCLSAAAFCRRSTVYSLLSGVCVAMAALTKPQMSIAAAGFVVALALSRMLGWRTGRAIAAAFLGLGLPILVWNGYQVLIIGPAHWLRVTFGGVAMLGSLAGLDILLQAERYLPVAAAVLVAGLAMMAAVTMLSGPRRDLRLRRLGARLALACVVLAPLFVMKWDRVLVRLVQCWNVNAVDTVAALIGLATMLLVALYRLDVRHIPFAIIGILLAEWYFGLSTLDFVRYSIYWRKIGLIDAGIVLGLAARYALSRLHESSPRTSAPPPTARRWRGLAASVLALGAIGFVLVQGAAVVQVPSRHNDDLPTAANWLALHTPRDALLLGSGWWLPWAEGVMSDRDIADVGASAFESVVELRRPKYLVMHVSRLGQVDLVPDVETTMRRPDSKLYQAGDIAVYRWDYLVDLEGLRSLRAVDVDLLQWLAAGKLILSPVPKGGILDNEHGNFYYPFVMKMVQGVMMISPSTMTAHGLPIAPGAALLLGYFPQQAGDGLSLTVVARSGDAEQVLVDSYIDTERPSQDSYDLLVIPLDEFANRQISLTVEVSSKPIGDTTADWLFVGPLAVVRTE